MGLGELPPCSLHLPINPIHPSHDNVTLVRLVKPVGHRRHRNLPTLSTFVLGSFKVAPDGIIHNGTKGAGQTAKVDAAGFGSICFPDCIISGAVGLGAGRSVFGKFVCWKQGRKWIR